MNEIEKKYFKTRVAAAWAGAVTGILAVIAFALIQNWYACVWAGGTVILFLTIVALLHDLKRADGDYSRLSDVLAEERQYHRTTKERLDRMTDLANQAAAELNDTNDRFDKMTALARDCNRMAMTRMDEVSELAHLLKDHGYEDEAVEVLQRYLEVPQEKQEDDTI